MQQSASMYDATPTEESALGMKPLAVRAMEQIRQRAREPRGDR